MPHVDIQKSKMQIYSNPFQTIWTAGEIFHKVGAFVIVMAKDHREPSLILTSLQILWLRTIFSSKMPYNYIYICIHL